MAVSKSLYRDSLLSDRRLRRKDDTTDDVDTYTPQVDPGTIFATVGGSADAGSLTITIVPVDTTKHPTPAPIVWTRTAETINQSAEGLYNAILTALATTAGAANVNPYLPLYLMRAEYTAATAIVRVIPNPHAHPFLVTMTGTGGTMTLTYTPDDTFPITAFAAKQVGNNVEHPPTHVVMTVHSVGTTDDVNAIGTCTFDLQGLRVIDRYDTVADVALRPGVEDEGTLTGLLLGEPVEMPLGGGRWGVRFTNIANAPSGHDAFAVHYREVVR